MIAGFEPRAILVSCENSANCTTPLPRLDKESLGVNGGVCVV